MVEAKVETRDMRGRIASKRMHVNGMSRLMARLLQRKSQLALFFLYLEIAHAVDYRTLPCPMGQPGYLQCIITAKAIG
jgi:hypothetical protein